MQQEKKQIILASILTLILVITLILVASHNFIRDADKKEVNYTISGKSISDDDVPVEEPDYKYYPQQNILLKKITTDSLFHDKFTTHWSYGIYYINPDFDIDLKFIEDKNIEFYMLMDGTPVLLTSDIMPEISKQGFIEMISYTIIFVLIPQDLFLNIQDDDYYLNFKDTFYKFDLSEFIETNPTTIKNLINQITSLQTQIDTLTNLVNILQTQVNISSEEIENLNNDILTLENEQEELIKRYERLLVEQYNKGYGAGVNDAKNLFPAFFGAIGDFFKKFTSIEIFGITLGSFLTLLIGIGAVVFVLRLVKG